MFGPKSRYNQVEDAIFEAPDGTRIPYKKRRFPPPPAVVSTVVSAEVRPGERLDLFAARALGDPLLFWRVCDANRALDPFELVRQPGRQLKVPLVYIQGAR